MTEELGAVIVLVALGLFMLVMGALGRSQRIEYNLGGWTHHNSSEASRRTANRVIGRHFMIAGAAALAGVAAVAASPATWTGPLMISTCVVVLGVTVVGVVRGLNRVEA